MDSTVVLSYQLDMVDNCRFLSHLCYVIDAPHLSLFKQLFKKVKTPIWCKLSMPDQQKGQSYLLVEPRHHPPHQVINHKPVFVLPGAVVGMKMDFSFTKGMVFKKMMGYDSICPLPDAKRLINEIVDLKRVNTSVIGTFCDNCFNLVTNLLRDTLTKYGTFPGCQKVHGAQLQWIVRIVYL